MRRALCVFARAPVPGQVKSRLAATLGAARAAALYAAFLEDTMAAAAEAARGKAAALELCVAGQVAHPTIVALAARHGAAVTAQPEGDLGARIGDAIDRHVAAGGGACVIGSDAPQLGAAQLGRGLEALAGHEVVIGPSRDGGYWMIGARRRVPELLRDMPWSTPELLPRTLERLAGRSAALLELAFDVDEPADLELLRRWLAVVPDAAPATRRLLVGPPPLS